MAEERLPWQRMLDGFVEHSGAAHFRQSLQAIRERHGDEADMVAAAFVALLGEVFLAAAGLFAALDLPPEQARAALEEIERTVKGFDYKREQRSLKRTERRYYQAFARMSGALLPPFVEAMRAVIGRYVGEEYDLQADPDELVAAALSGAEQDLAAAREQISHAGALVLAGKPCWPRWSTEATGPAASWVRSVFHLTDVMLRAGLQGPLAEVRRMWQEQATEAEAEPGEEEDLTALPTESSPSLGDQVVGQLIALGEQPLPEEVWATCQAHREEVIPALLALAADEDLRLDTAPGAGWGPIHAVEILGQLQAEEAIPLLIDLVADEDDPAVILRDRALVALESCGPAVKDALLQFMRYSRRNIARADMASILARAGRGDEQVYQALLALLPQISWEEGRAFVYAALGETGDRRAIPLLQEALQDPAASSLDRSEIAEALAQLGGELPPGYEEEGGELLGLPTADSIGELLASLPPEILADSERAAYFVADALIAMSCPVFLALIRGADQEGEAEWRATFFQNVREMRFEGELKHGSEQVRAAYRCLVERAAPYMQETLRGLATILEAYLAGQYDLDTDPNEQIARARELLPQDEEGALRLIGQAGAAVLRGSSCWQRWPQETMPPLAFWLLGLDRMVSYLQAIGRYPLAAAKEEGKREEVWGAWPERKERKVSPPLQELLDRLWALPKWTNRPEGELLAAFERHREEAIPELIALARDRDTWVEDETGQGGWAPVVAVRLLGYLQAEQAAPLLVDIVAETVWDDVLQEAALGALRAIGRPAAPAVLDYFRYGLDVESKVALAEVLARVADKDASTFPLLAKLWEEATWSQQRRLVAVALADLGDRRAIPLLQAAIDDPRSDFADQVHVRWALQRLGRGVGLFPTSRLFYGFLERTPRISTPVQWPPLLELDAEEGTVRRARYTVWGEPICHHCGQPMVWAGEEEGWIHPLEVRPAGPGKKQAGKKRKRKRR